MKKISGNCINIKIIMIIVRTRKKILTGNKKKKIIKWNISIITASSQSTTKKKKQKNLKWKQADITTMTIYLFKGMFDAGNFWKLEIFVRVKSQEIYILHFVQPIFIFNILSFLVSSLNLVMNINRIDRTL